ILFLINVEDDIDPVLPDGGVKTCVIGVGSFPLQVGVWQAIGHLAGGGGGSVTAEAVVAIHHIADGAADERGDGAIIADIVVPRLAPAEAQLQGIDKIDRLHKFLLRKDPAGRYRWEGTVLVSRAEARGTVAAEGTGEQVFSLVAVLEAAII